MFIQGYISIFFQMFYQYFLPCVVQVRNIFSGMTAVLKWINLSNGSNPLKFCQIFKIVIFSSLRISSYCLMKNTGLNGIEWLFCF